MRPPPFLSSSTSSPLHSSVPFYPLHDRGDCQCSAALTHHRARARMGRARVCVRARRERCERCGGFGGGGGGGGGGGSVSAAERKSGEGRKEERTDEVEGTGNKGEGGREEARDAKTHRQKDTGRQEILPLSVPHIAHLPTKSSRLGDKNRFTTPLLEDWLVIGWLMKCI